MQKDRSPRSHHSVLLAFHEVHSILTAWPVACLPDVSPLLLLGLKLAWMAIGPSLVLGNWADEPRECDSHSPLLRTSLDDRRMRVASEQCASDTGWRDSGTVRMRKHRDDAVHRTVCSRTQSDALGAVLV